MHSLLSSRPTFFLKIHDGQMLVAEGKWNRHSATGDWAKNISEKSQMSISRVSKFSRAFGALRIMLRQSW